MTRTVPQSAYFLPASAKGGFSLLLILFTLSGAVGLVFQLVWMYRLGLIFGNAVYATSATLAAFFLGLATGGWFWGKVTSQIRRPLSVYALMELAIAATALLWPLGVQLYQNHYASLVSLLPESRPLMTFLKLLFSMSLLLIPTMFMGGTFPMLVHYVGQVRQGPAKRGTLLYAANTLGAAIGVILAGFFFMARLGVSATYYLAIAAAALVGISAWLLDRFSQAGETEHPASEQHGRTQKPKRLRASASSLVLSQRDLSILAASTGFLALALETLWFRMFAQVLQNSVYSFSAILVVFLLALGLAGLLAHGLIRRNGAPDRILGWLLLSGALLTALTPFLFDALTGGLQYVALRASWPQYLWEIFKLSFLIILPPVLLLGAVFPYLLKIAPDIERAPGRIVGKLVFLNALGSTLGPIVAGFILLNVLGLWRSIQLVAFAYAALLLLVQRPRLKHLQLKRLAPPVLLVIAVIMFITPPVVHLKPGENLVQVWQASDGVVSVVRSADNLEMRLDNYYTLGDTRSALVEQMQGHIPLLLHPDPKRILFLGMGTGITAGAALHHPVQQVVAVELVDNVIRAAKRYFSPWTNGLFSSPITDIVADDARNYLLGHRQAYDVIVGDLFTPWHAGTGSLYTLEHFQQAKQRLAEGGLFVQWLPLYQLTPEGFYTIAKTFAQVFPTVTLWRADFSGTRATAALVGQPAGATLDQEVLQKNIRHVLGKNGTAGKTEHMAGLFYMGNLLALQNTIQSAPINTDDRRTIEFHAPVQAQQANAGQTSYIMGRTLENLLLQLFNGLPPENDPYLSGLPEQELRYVEVGLLYYRYLQARAAGQPEKAERIRERIRKIAPDFLKQPAATP